MKKLLPAIFMVAIAITSITTITAADFQTEGATLLNDTYSGAGIIAEAPISIDQWIGRIVQAIFAVIGIVFLVLTIYAGFLWMTAGGNETQVGKAKKILVQSIIGLLLMMSAYAISIFVLGKLG